MELDPSIECTYLCLSDIFFFLNAQFCEDGVLVYVAYELALCQNAATGGRQPGYSGKAQRLYLVELHN